MYLTECLVSDFKQPLWSDWLVICLNIENLSILSSLVRDVLSEVICGPHVEKFGDPCISNNHFNKNRFRRRYIVRATEKASLYKLHTYIQSSGYTNFSFCGT
jgi:hypothetical protein